MSFSKSTSTNTIFKNRKISFEVKDNDYRFVKANEDINEDELLLIEHVITSDNETILKTHIKYDNNLLKNLYPRNEDDIIINEDDVLNKICCEKLQKNCFGGNDIILLGKDISNFNHSITPNARYCFIEIINDMIEVKITILYVYSIEKIKKNIEVFINYGKAYFNDTIEPVYDKNEKVHLVKSIIEKYVKKDIFFNIVFNHICSYYGIYYNDNNDIIITPRFLKTFKNLDCYDFINNKVLSVFNILSSYHLNI
jgi:hypothetical protein